MEKQIKQILERLTKLEEKVFSGQSAIEKKEIKNQDVKRFDFTLNDRAFIKKYSEGLNGQQSFVLFCAYLAQGKDGVYIGLKEIRNIWTKCHGLIGYPFQSIYATRAKDSGWVDTPKDKKATYFLRKSWQQALGKI